MTQLSRQVLDLFVILGEAAGRPMHVDEIAAKLYGDREWPRSYADGISTAVQKLRPTMKRLGLGISCRLQNYWLCDLERDITISGRRRPGLGFSRHGIEGRDAVRNAALIAARRDHLVPPEAGR